ncbi:hypothetical protein LWI29_022415 [Acer saccharum]|uniref:Uncharacterized protein n=1 Tax=Acer saccharum TaxID=4024 RepID=A0AA39RIF9_ACESA|nr:hypothetical protein LWI29_022415 [Acer saccharum]
MDPSGILGYILTECLMAGKNSHEGHVITMEGQVSRGQDKSTYGAETSTITYSEKRISSPTTKQGRSARAADQIQAHSGTLGHTRAYSLGKQ